MSGAIDRLAAGLRTSALDEVRTSRVWKDGGAKSPQRWVAQKLGVTVAEAHRIVATTERLREQRLAVRRRSGLTVTAVSSQDDGPPEHAQPGEYQVVFLAWDPEVLAVPDPVAVTVT